MESAVESELARAITNGASSTSTNRRSIDVGRRQDFVDSADVKYPFEALSESIRNRPSGVPLSNAEVLEVLRWAKARWDETAIEAGLR